MHGGGVGRKPWRQSLDKLFERLTRYEQARKILPHRSPVARQPESIRPSTARPAVRRAK